MKMTKLYRVAALFVFVVALLISIGAPATKAQAAGECSSFVRLQTHVDPQWNPRDLFQHWNSVQAPNNGVDYANLINRGRGYITYNGNTQSLSFWDKRTWGVPTRWVIVNPTWLWGDWRLYICGSA